jgi:hypothetical protein
MNCVHGHAPPSRLPPVVHSGGDQRPPPPPPQQQQHHHVGHNLANVNHPGQGMPSLPPGYVLDPVQAASATGKSSPELAATAAAAPVAVTPEGNTYPAHGSHQRHVAGNPPRHSTSPCCHHHPPGHHPNYFQQQHQQQLHPHHPHQQEQQPLHPHRQDQASTPLRTQLQGTGASAHRADGYPSRRVGGSSVSPHHSSMPSQFYMSGEFSWFGLSKEEITFTLLERKSKSFLLMTSREHMMLERFSGRCLGYS